MVTMKKMQVFLMVLTNFMISVTSAQTKTDVVVILPNGPIRGTHESVLSLANLPYLKARELTYRKYLGIPYADPPVRALRFKPPQPLSTTWTEARYATNYSNSCWQYPELFTVGDPDEDCLYLNIWAPGNGSSSPREAKAVMVYIHGGGYAWDSAMSYDPTMLTVIGDVVVVTMNYRLGIFGFLSTGDDVVPGNMGLLDQQLAIRWVKDNIALFGGDPERITIFGQSAGASSVTQHATSPTNIGLFKRAISQAGTISSEFAIRDTDVIPLVRQTAEAVGCGNLTMEDLIECLQYEDTKELLTTWPVETVDRFWSWNPIVDDNFIVDAPLNILKKKKGPAQRMLKSIDLMIGFNSNDGFVIVWWWAYLNLPKGSPRAPLAWNDTVLFLPLLQDLIRDYIVENSLESIASVIQDAFLYTYLGPNKAGDDKDNENMADITHQFITDYWYKIAAIEFSQLYAALGGSPYLYQLTQRKANDNEDIAWLKGAKHGDDIDYIFPDIVSFLDRPKEEQLLSYNMITYWANFAKTGDPNKPVADPALQPAWPIFTVEKGQYLDLSNNITPVDDITKNDRVRLWTEFLPKVAASAKCDFRKMKRKMNRKGGKTDDE